MSIAHGTNVEAKPMNMNTHETPVNQTLINPLGIERNLRMKEVINAVGLSRATIYRMMTVFKFPLAMKVSLSLVGWKAEELRQYMTLGPDGWYEQYGKHQEAAKHKRQGL